MFRSLSFSLSILPRFHSFVKCSLSHCNETLPLSPLLLCDELTIISATHNIQFTIFEHSRILSVIWGKSYHTSIHSKSPWKKTTQKPPLWHHTYCDCTCKVLVRHTKPSKYDSMTNDQNRGKRGRKRLKKPCIFLCRVKYNPLQCSCFIYTFETIFSTKTISSSAYLHCFVVLFRFSICIRRCYHSYEE